MSDYLIRDFNEHKRDLIEVREFIGPHLSEPYTVFTYYFFLTYYPELTFTITNPEDKLLGIIIGRTEELRSSGNTTEEESQERKKGYIAMLVIDPCLRRKGFGKTLINKYLDVVSTLLDSFPRLISEAK